MTHMGNIIALIIMGTVLLTPSLFPEGEPEARITEFIDANGDKAYIPAGFTVSEKDDERLIDKGLVVVGPDSSEFVWIPTDKTKLRQRDFHSDLYGNAISAYEDETSLKEYRDMERSVAKYGGFYMGRYEASYGGGKSRDDYYPASKKVTADHPGRIWVRFSPQDATKACENLYRDNPTVQGFFPWGANWDTMLQWLIDSGAKTQWEVTRDSSDWGNYSNSLFVRGSSIRYTGAYEQAKANNIYDLAGNNWEWTQERCGSSYVMRGGGNSIMGFACEGDMAPAAIRDPLPGSSHHPNVTFRVALYLK